MSKPSFLNRNFVLLTQAQLVNQAGSQMALAATAFWLKQVTNSATLVGLMSALAALPLLLLGPLGGACADRLSRRNILIACDLLCGMVSAVVAMLLYGQPGHVSYDALGLFLGTVILSSAIAFTSPALNALIPSLVVKADVGAAMAFSQASGFLALIVGQLLGGVLLTRYLPAVLFWVNAGSYFVSALAELFVRTDARVILEPHQQRPGIFHDIREGFSYVWHRRGMRVLLLAAIPLNVLTTPVIVFLPFYTTNSLGQPLARYGYLLAALSVGLLTGYAISGRLPPQQHRRHAALFGCVGGCAAIIVALAFLQTFWRVALLIGLLGALIGIVTLISLNAFIQQTEPNKRGRVGAVLLMTTQGITPIAMFAIGMLSDAMGNNIRVLYGACGMLLAATVVATSTNRDLRDFLQHD